MLSLLRSPSRSASTAVMYVTIGVLMMIWTGVWYYAAHESWAQEDGQTWQKYLCIGLFLSGLAVTVIGLLVGQIGGAAKDADNTVGVAQSGPVMAAPQMVQPGMVQPGMVAQPGMVMQPGMVQPGQMPPQG